MIVGVGMFVAIEGQRAIGPRPKERAIGRGRSHMFRSSVTADMAVQTDHPIRGRHDNMEFVTDQKDAAAHGVPYLFDPVIKGRGARLIQPLGGLIEDKKIRRAQ